jgi:hypothetical protein
MLDEWCQRDRSQVGSHRIYARSNLIAEQRLSGTPVTRESCRRNSFTCMRRLYYHMVVPSECIRCIDWRNAISLSSIDEFSPDRDFGSGFIAGAGRQLSVRAYCTFAACNLHQSACRVQQMRAECDLSPAVILARCSLQVRLDVEGAVVTLFVCCIFLAVPMLE